jgi:hypothetical protein
MTTGDDLFLYEHLKSIADETKASLGEETCGLFLFLYSDLVDVWGAIGDVYGSDTALTSLVAADLYALSKELLWLHRLWHWSAYPLVYRNLRVCWEMMFLAYHVDTFADRHPEDADPPGRNLDDKVDWLHRRCRRKLWDKIIGPLTAEFTSAEDLQGYQQIWGALNKACHSTKQLRDKMVNDSSLFVKDAFDEAWARESLSVSGQVFELIWLIVPRRFPNCMSSLEQAECFTPRTWQLARRWCQ